MKKQIKYLSQEKQQTLLPNHRAVKYHNASINKESSSRNWMIDISCYNNPNGTFYNMLSDEEKNNPIRYYANIVFTNKKKALDFIKQVNN